MKCKNCSEESQYNLKDIKSKESFDFCANCLLIEMLESTKKLLLKLGRMDITIKEIHL